MPHATRCPRRGVQHGAPARGRRAPGRPPVAGPLGEVRTPAGRTDQAGRAAVPGGRGRAGGRGQGGPAGWGEYVGKMPDRPAKLLATTGWDRPVAPSKTFRTLARLAGAAPSVDGPLARRMLTLTGLHQVRSFIQYIPSAKLADMDGF